MAAFAALLAATPATASDLPTLRGPMRASTVETLESEHFGIDTQMISLVIGVAVIVYIAVQYANRDEPSSP